ncbi:DEAD/DEAH box helicase [Candidatus Poriferisodalis sp.]|uniref:DEAD/DEAH box helicase n=1 Tax=Candidatus Poriferisodalis sp. TaxID=3101277 RepID=UPI003B020687
MATEHASATGAQASGRLAPFVPREPDADSLLEGFLDYTAAIGLEQYPAQEDAILEILGGNHVIITTPTGSGKSLVGLAAHFEAVARGRRSYYTAPVKALVSEKFFALCDELGAPNVGMVTGDGAVNPDAPVVCATQEILANLALRSGADAPIDSVVMDEFHFYSDRDRGWAWQVPLLELRRTQMILMSATFGPTQRFAQDLQRRTGREVVTVTGAQRPVPLTFAYRTTTLHQSLEELLELRRVPAYIVHFTQKAATERAQALTSLKVLSRDEKAQVAAAIAEFRFDSPFGRDIQRFVKAGIGVHHAGMLPKYRLLVERLAGTGLLKLICGTDTLGVGVNVPIRTVLFTQLCKYDGSGTRVLSVRDFQQIAGRAGRRGFDHEGFVWCQAPEHEVEYAMALEKAREKFGDDPAKLRRVRRPSPPKRGYAPWNADTFERLAGGQPEPLRSHFDVSHSMLMNVLDRPGDGCAAMRRLLTDNHESRAANRTHIRRAIAIYRSLVDAQVVERLEQPDELDRLVRVNVDLQAEFDLTHPLSPFALDAIEFLDAEAPTYTLDLLSVLEATLENPTVVLERQRDLVCTELLAELKAEGVDYEERRARLDAVEWPKPLRDWLYDSFNAWSTGHPWLRDENVRPKSVARDMNERAMTFREYVNHCGIKGAEGVLLRYLSGAYKALVRNVPEHRRTDDVVALTRWLGDTVRRTDSSLIDEWERLELLSEASDAVGRQIGTR